MKRLSMRLVISILAGVGLMAVTPHFAHASGNCLTAQAFAESGGKLTYISPINLDRLPENFFCDRVACFGLVEFQGIVDKRGAIRNLKATRNTWKNDPAYHAMVLMQRLKAARYAAPSVHNKAVCVESHWNVDPENGTVR